MCCTNLRPLMFMCVRSEMMEVLHDKERRTQQRLDRSAEERGRKMDEQKKKEQKRRAAAEEKRRQQQEAEKVRGHSTLMMHSQHISTHQAAADGERIRLQSC